MDHQIKRMRRVSFSDVEYTRLGAQSFRDEGNNNFRNEVYYNAKESDEYAASIAAAAYAIYSLEETRAEFERRMVESFREDPSSRDQQVPLEIPDLRGLSRRSSSRFENNDVGGGPMRRSSTRPIEISGPIQSSSVILPMGTSKADAWERARLAKINKWYEKMNAKIMEWENEKKKRAGLDMEKRKAEIERLKRINLSHYQNKINKIEDISKGAKQQLEEKRRSEETYAKQKARKIRTTGRIPVKCFCFEY
ncbi:hypothetical protein vseg_017171 [Gypsophila vaccaria]